MSSKITILNISFTDERSKFYGSNKDDKYVDLIMTLDFAGDT